MTNKKKRKEKKKQWDEVKIKEWKKLNNIENSEIKKNTKNNERKEQCKQ